MKNKRNRAGKIGSCLLTVALACSLLCGCNNPRSKENIAKAIKKSYMQDTGAFATQAEENEKYLPAAIEQMITQKVSVTVLEQEKDYLVLEIKAPNMYEIYSNLASTEETLMNDSEILAQTDRQVYEILKSGTYSIATNTVTVDIEKINKRIEIIPNFEYIDAIYGNMLTYYYEITEG